MSHQGHITSTLRKHQGPNPLTRFRSRIKWMRCCLLVTTWGLETTTRWSEYDITLQPSMDWPQRIQHWTRDLAFSERDESKSTAVALSYIQDICSTPKSRGWACLAKYHVPCLFCSRSLNEPGLLIRGLPLAARGTTLLVNEIFTG